MSTKRGIPKPQYLNMRLFLAKVNIRNRLISNQTTDI